MKKIITILLFFAAFKLCAQVQTAKGFTFLSQNIQFKEKGVIMSVKTAQIYNISFKDMILVHNDLDDDIDSQIYVITSYSSSYFLGDKSTRFTFNAKSGVSGAQYCFTIDVRSDDSADVLITTSESNIVFTGIIFGIKTYKK